MVKVFPSNFTLFEKQNIFTPSGEPLAITCSDECLFIAIEGCMLEAYKIDELEPIAQFRTISGVVQFVYNPVGDCIVTLERRQPDSHGFARVYFKWRGSSIDKPVRVSLMQSLPRSILSPSAPPDRFAAEIVELPADASNSVSCLACCRQSGRIAIGMGSTVRVFSFAAEFDGPASPKEFLSHNIEILVDVRTNMAVNKVTIFDDYIGFASGHEARVVKLSFHSDTKRSLRDYRVRKEDDETQTEVPTSDEILQDPNFMTWSPSKVWETERQAVDSRTTSPSEKEGRDLERLDLVTPRDAKPQPNRIGAISLKSIAHATLIKTTERHAVEVLGPVEYVWGQPLEVEVNYNANTNGSPKCRVLTMLYRRLSPLTTSYEVVRSVTPPQMARQTSQTGQTGQEGGDEGGLHSIQLLPTLVEGHEGPEVVGMCCFLGNKYHGYLYDVHRKAKPVSYLSFMTKSRAVCCDSGFIHALSANSVESYTSRTFPAAVANMPPSSTCIPPRVGERRSVEEGEGEGEGERGVEEREGVISDFKEWLKQPCPSPSLDLTLVSSNKFVGCCSLAASQDHMAVLVKSEESTARPQDDSPSGWFLQSLSLRRPGKPPEPAWHIYVLRKRDSVAMHQQFVEFAGTLKDSSPPMYQHILSEGHILVRSELLQGSAVSIPQSLRTLQESCPGLVDALCICPYDKRAVSSAARYLIMSGLPVAEVVQHITSRYPKESKTPYSILMSYLNLVLFDRANAATQAETLRPLSDKLLELYAELEPQQLTKMLLNSWLEDYSAATATEVLEACSDSFSTPEESHLGQLCQVMLLLRLGRAEDAGGKLGQIPEEFLVSWLENNLGFVVNVGTSKMTDLGKAIHSSRESCFLEFITHCLATQKLSFEAISMCLESHHQEMLADNVVLKQFLEKIILSKVELGSLDSLPKAVLLLIDVIFARLCSIAPPRPSPSAPFSLYGSRYQWLDSIAPFDGMTSLGTTSSQSNLQDLMQLQALLCSPHMTTKVANRVEELLALSGDGMTGALSLKLLAWPHTHKMNEATLLVLDSCPSVTVDYCLTFFDTHLQQWRQLLDILLQYAQRETAPELQEEHQSVYKSALDHVVLLTSPEEFFSVLPPNGSLDFYLPFIETSCKLFAANQIAEELHTSVLHQ